MNVLSHSQRLMVALSAALVSASASGQVLPKADWDSRAAAKASIAERTIMQCPDVFQVKVGVKPRFDDLTLKAKTQYPGAFWPAGSSSAMELSVGDKATCAKQAVNFFCNVRTDEFVELTDETRLSLNQTISEMEFTSATYPTMCRSRMPL